MATLKPSTLHAQMVDALSCSICFLPYDQQDRLPKLFPCAHTVCLACAQGLCQQQLDGQVPCPHCRQVVSIPPNGASRLPTNLGVTQVVEIMQQTQPSSDSSTKCPHHPPKSITHVCMTCTVGLCARCFTTPEMKEHLKHELRELDDAVEDLKQRSAVMTEIGVESIQSLHKQCQERQTDIAMVQHMITALTEHQYPKSSLTDWLKNLSTLQSIIAKRNKTRDISSPEFGEVILSDENCTEAALKSARDGLNFGKSELDKLCILTDEAVVTTKLASISVLVDLLRLNVQRNQKIEEILRLLMGMTTASEPACRRLVSLGGAGLLVLCFERNVRDKGTSSDVINVCRDLLGSYLNLAKHLTLHEYLLSIKSINMMVYCANINDSAFAASHYLACGVLSFFLSNESVRWPSDCPSRREVDRLVQYKVERMGNVIPMIGLRPKSLVALVSQNLSGGARVWAVYTLHRYVTNDPGKYCPSLIREGGVAILKTQNFSGRWEQDRIRSILAAAARYQSD